jgi:hypothetical protein
MLSCYFVVTSHTAAADYFSIIVYAFMLFNVVQLVLRYYNSCYSCTLLVYTFECFSCCCYNSWLLLLQQMIIYYVLYTSYIAASVIGVCFAATVALVLLLV